MDHYIDTPNKEEIIEKLHTLENAEEIRAFVDEIFPEWLVYATKTYSKDYEYLHKNWYAVCRMIPADPQMIVLVKSIIFDDDHTIMKEVCEVMTKRGFCVRRLEEFTVCSVCNGVIPVKEVWELMNSKKMPVPETWSNTCSGCLTDEKKD
jgi:hypothetical protein